MRELDNDPGSFFANGIWIGGSQREEFPGLEKAGESGKRCRMRLMESLERWQIVGAAAGFLDVGSTASRECRLMIVGVRKVIRKSTASVNGSLSGYVGCIEKVLVLSQIDAEDARIRALSKQFEGTTIKYSFLGGAVAKLSDS